MHLTWCDYIWIDSNGTCCRNCSKVGEHYWDFSVNWIHIHHWWDWKRQSKFSISLRFLTRLHSQIMSFYPWKLTNNAIFYVIPPTNTTEIIDQRFILNFFVSLWPRSRASPAPAVVGGQFQNSEPSFEVFGSGFNLVTMLH